MLEPARLMATTPLTPTRPELKALLVLSGLGVVVACVRFAVRSELFANAEGAGGVVDLLGCLASAGSLYGVLAIRSLATNGPTPRELDDAVGSLAVTAWLVALLPPRSTDMFGAAVADEFPFVYLPASLLAVMLVRGASMAWPERTRFWLTTRTAPMVGALCLGVGLAINFGIKGPGAGDVWAHARVGALACFVVFAATVASRRRGW